MRARSRTPRRARTEAAAAVASDAVRWRAVVARDGAADGTFVFAVRTTGVYCRPACPARRPLRANVAFFADGVAARAAGFRACKRCAPDAARSPDAERRALVVQVCRWLDEAERTPTLAALAQRTGYSPFHLQRTFRALVGTTPRAYAAARRAERLRAQLAGGAPVTAAMHRAGYGSTSRLHADAERVLGMQPNRARRGGVGEGIDYHTAACSLGRVLVAATERGLCAVLLGDNDGSLVDELAQRFPQAERRRGDATFAARVRAVVAFVDGEAGDPQLPLDVRGTAFQQRVWQALTRIPRGRTIDYAGLAAELGLPRAARAVAAACAANPLAVLVPCHRVVRGDGALAGYRWGLARKQALLAREGATPGGQDG